MRIAVIGAGASGCFFAVEAKRRIPEAELMVYEAGRKPMAKLALTGGGRCNITNTFESVGSLSRVYPRGDKFMKRALKCFGPGDVLRWFEAEGVRFVSQPDGCVFPESQDAMQIVRTLERLMRQLGIRVVCGRRVVRLHCAVAGSPADGGAGAFVLEFSDGSRESADRVLLASGGSNAAFLRNMLPENVEIVPTVPSLFTFRVADEKLHALRPFDQLLMDLADEDPDLMAFLDRMVDYWLEAIDYYAALGTDVFVFGDDWGMQKCTLIDPALFRKIYRPRYEKLFNRVKQHGGLIFLHCCGYMGELLDEFLDMGLRGLWPQLNLYDRDETFLQKCIDHRVAMYIHPDRQRLIPLGTPREIDDYIRMMADRYHKIGGGAIFYVEIENDAPFENVKALIEAVDRYR